MFLELPAELRQAIERVIGDTPASDLRIAAARLSTRYRAEIRDGFAHLDSDLAVKAYLAARLPATFAALVTSLAEAATALADFSPAQLLDVGAGPGTAWWAARQVWGTLVAGRLVEASAAARAFGAALLPEADQAAVRFVAADALRDLSVEAPADLVTLSYVLDELPPAQIAGLADMLWERTRSLLVVVEPGTSGGWQRILAVRDRLIAAGAFVVAPCPHDGPCPLASPNWCHFSRRVARSRLHRLTKHAELPWEDEKFAYVALARRAPDIRAPRVIAAPRSSKGRVDLDLCQPGGSARATTFSKRDGSLYRSARRADWGDSLDVEGG